MQINYYKNWRNPWRQPCCGFFKKIYQAIWWFELFWRHSYNLWYSCDCFCWNQILSKPKDWNWKLQSDVKSSIFTVQINTDMISKESTLLHISIIQIILKNGLSAFNVINKNFYLLGLVQNIKQFWKYLCILSNNFEEETFWSEFYTLILTLKNKG